MMVRMILKHGDDVRYPGKLCLVRRTKDEIITTSYVLNKNNNISNHYNNNIEKIPLIKWL